MKKLIGLLAIIFALSFSTSAVAQSPMTTSGSIENSGTATLTSKGHYVAESTLAIQAVITKDSGTVAGSCILQGTIDYNNYLTVPGADTLTLTNIATNTGIWVLDAPKYIKYKVLCTGSGTMAAALTGYEHAK